MLREWRARGWLEKENSKNEYSNVMGIYFGK